MKGKILFVDLRESIPARDDIDVAVATIFINISCSSPGAKLKKKIPLQSFPCVHL